MDIQIPQGILEALRPEGSDLLIQKANSDNLDWTWRVRHHDGRTGRSTTCTGAYLVDTLEMVSGALRA